MVEDKISVHEVRLLLVFQQQADRWHTNNEVAEAAKISPRTARAHTARLVRLGVLQEERIFPAHKYRLTGTSAQEAADYLERWQKAREIFGL